MRDSIGKKAIDRNILRLEEENLGNHKFCREGVWDLRIHAGAGYRVIILYWEIKLFCCYVAVLKILSNKIYKKQQNI